MGLDTVELLIEFETHIWLYDKVGKSPGCFYARAHPIHRAKVTGPEPESFETAKPTG
jgi:hypothetical protein